MTNGQEIYIKQSWLLSFYDDPQSDPRFNDGKVAQKL